MKNQFIFLLTLFILLSSCHKDEEIVAPTPTCDFTVEFVTFQAFCSFAPKLHPTVKVPMGLNFKGERIDSDKYLFFWDGAPFGGAKSIIYNELPITVKIIEKATDCEVLVTLDKDFFD